MGAMGIKHEDGSPFARAARELTALAYHVVPIIPPDASHPAAGKAPGKFTAGEWRGLGEWERFRDRAPTEFELTLWSANYPDANIGIVCGSPAGDGLVVIAVDIDTNDFEEIDILLGALPHAVMSKKGAKGQTLFYRAPADIKSKSYDLGVRPHARRVLDLLTGSQTRQTVAPPSNHASGAVYRWLSGPAPAHDLTVFDETALEKLEDTLASLGWNPDAMRATRAANPSRAPLDPDDIWSETKSAALVRLVDWAPHLGLYNLRRARAGFEAVATWRESSTGRPLEERKRNLSIQPTGIKDFGTGETFSPLDLVMRAQGCDLETATAWLRARLGFDDTPVMVLAPAKENEVVMLPQVAPPSVVAPLSVVAREEEHPWEMSGRLATGATGFLGALVEWIRDTSMQPMAGPALATAIALLSAVAGRRFAGPTLSGTHLYTMVLAPSGAGKDHYIDRIQRVLQVRTDLAHRLIGDFQTAPGVYNRLTRDPVGISLIDEVGEYLAQLFDPRANPYEKRVPGAIRTQWGRSFKTMLTPELAGKPSVAIHSPAISLFGLSTEEEFFGGFQHGAVKNGFSNRLSLFATRLNPSDSAIRSSSDLAVVPPHVIRTVNEIACTNVEQVSTLHNRGAPDRPEVVATWSADAESVYRDAKQWERSHPLEVRDFYKRTAEKALRIATICAIGDNPAQPHITKSTMRWAFEVSRHCDWQMEVGVRDFVSDTIPEAELKFVFRIIKQHGRIARSDLLGRCSKILPRNFKDIVGALVESERVAELREATGGRPKLIYVFLKD